MVKSTFFLVLIGGLTLILASLLLTGTISSNSGKMADLAGKRQLVRTLMLTDLSLCSEARYTRHPSQADLFSAFQDFPGAFEHFPTGSMIAPNPTGFSQPVQIHHRPEHE